MDLDEIFIKCLKWDKEQSIKNTVSMLMVGFQSPGIILWSRHSIGGLSCLGGGLRSLVCNVFNHGLFDNCRDGVSIGLFKCLWFCFCV